MTARRREQREGVGGAAQQIPYEEWDRRGRELFGYDMKEWKFKCPVCGFIQSFNDFLKAGVDYKDAEKLIAFSCIGRVLKDCPGKIGNRKSPCDYAGGGLFKLNPVTVVTFEGKEHSVFDFALEPPVGAP